MLKQILWVWLCLSCLYTTAQEEIIIDNGYLSTQGWGGAVHPSGNYFVRSDRTILHAYSTKNGMLFKTYQGECIAYSLRFSPDGKYLTVSTFGEMGDECRRVIVFDFYTGEMVFNQPASGYIAQPLRPDLLTVAVFNENAMEMIEVYAYSNLEKPLTTYNFYGTNVDGIEYCFNSIMVDSLFINCADIIDVQNGEVVECPEASPGSFARTVLPTHQLVLTGANEDTVVFMNPVTKEYTTRKVPFNSSFFHYLLAEGDSVLRFVNITHKRTVRWNLKTDEYTTEWPFAGTAVADAACEYRSEYTGHANNSANAVVHVDEYLFDFNSNRISSYPMYIDTTLLHPGIVYLYPNDSARITVNGQHWKWSEPNTIPEHKEWFMFDTLYDPGMAERYKLDAPKFTYPLSQRLSNFAYKGISYPYAVDEYGEAPFGGYQDNESGLRDPEYVYAYDMGDTIAITLLETAVKFPKKYLSMPDNDAKLAREVIKQKFNRDTLSELNSALPELYYAFDYRWNDEDKNSTRIVTTAKPGKNQWISDLYYPLNIMVYGGSGGGFDRNSHYKGETVSKTINLSDGRDAYLDNLLKVTYSGPGYGMGDEYYIVNAFNRTDMPDLTLAGIYPANDLAFFPITFPTLDGRYLRVNYAYGSIEMLDAKQKPIVTLYMYTDRRFIYVTPDGYYWVSKGLNKKISVRKDAEVYPIEQFDMKYNRPDIILERMGYSSTEVIKSYRGAYQKRLQKAGFTESMLSADFHLPEITVSNLNEIPATTNDPTVDISLSLTDSKYKLDRINVWVNDVPVYGANGISLRKQNVQQHNTTLKLLLSEGANKIQVSTLNGAGAESYRQTMNVTYNPYQQAVSKTYYIGIGVSYYADTTHNLDYADKDVKDLSAAFKDAQVTLLTNEQATRENILALKKQLLQTNVEDKVIVSISGHGLLSDNYDYYLATYNIDFSKPEINGLSYNELEQLLDSIPARKKLLLIDACHSGEVDKEELLAINSTKKKEGVKGAYVEYAYKPKLGMKNSFELMQELFTNVNRGTGATVIAASGGTQFAQEGGGLTNGVFTYSILEAMQQQQNVTVSQLKTTVGKRVNELTHGLQQPTSRTENTENDWVVW